MKAKVWQETKNLSVTELEARLRETREQLFRLEFRHATTPLKNPLEIRRLRRDIARYRTLLKQKATAPEKTETKAKKAEAKAEPKTNMAAKAKAKPKAKSKARTKKQA